MSESLGPSLACDSEGFPDIPSTVIPGSPTFHQHSHRALQHATFQQLSHRVSQHSVNIHIGLPNIPSTVIPGSPTFHQHSHRAPQHSISGHTGLQLESFTLLPRPVMTTLYISAADCSVNIYILLINHHSLNRVKLTALYKQLRTKPIYIQFNNPNRDLTEISIM